MTRATLTKAITVGAVAGVVGTFVMDLFGMGLFLALGGPASLSFSIIGDAPRRSLLGWASKWPEASRSARSCTI